MPRGEDLLDLSDRVLSSRLAALELHSLPSKLNVLSHVSVFVQEVKVIDKYLPILTGTKAFQLRERQGRRRSQPMR